MARFRRAANGFGLRVRFRLSAKRRKESWDVRSFLQPEIIAECGRYAE